jgi:hypothetical protein
MDFTEEQKQVFSKMGKASKEKRFAGTTKEQRSAYMKLVRAKKTPSILVLDKTNSS